MLTEDELNWIRHVLSNYKPFEISPSYFYKMTTEIERNGNKGIVRKELDELRKKMIKVTPQELLEFRNKNVRERRGIYNFSGIYIIHNCVKDIYYVGQAERIFDRAYQHFVINAGNAEIYKDYSLGDEFSISLIPLENTSFSSLNELEDNAIRAYDSFKNGYNRMPGNIMDKHIFKNADYEKAANLILDKIKGTEVFLSLSNNRKRMNYTSSLFSELKLPRNIHFLLGFVKMIKEYQKAKK
ncbi:MULTISPECIES: GIY-YIG nuclease family protein [Bacillus]|uniref:Excinuclease ABC subunit C n=2 Tax=Bacillus TaxID=1386 RepID=A0A0M4FKJ0_9BACI|nr:MULTISPECIES: GIY-YIG nuclease family protein [Bacillus]ALC83899.1 excinuclease ABC subunit C [Bacillus gobiensis]MBP1083043.1 hypothetical protein [Bacillus capparidis]MED1097988.1 GIY-YIG nuclease family protein [Bacillus capparidis]